MLHYSKATSARLPTFFFFASPLHLSNILNAASPRLSPLPFLALCGRHLLRRLTLAAQHSASPLRAALRTISTPPPLHFRLLRLLRLLRLSSPPQTSESQQAAFPLLQSPKCLRLSPASSIGHLFWPRAFSSVPRSPTIADGLHRILSPSELHCI